MSLYQGVLLLLPLFFIGCSHEAWFSNKGVWSARIKEDAKAQDSFVRALIRNPNYFPGRYNLIFSKLTNEQIHEALKELEYLELQVKDQKGLEDLIFQVHFAKGFALGEIKNVDRALEAYQEALSLKPESVEVKKNIELLTKEAKKGGKREGSPSENSDKKSGKDKKDSNGKGQEQKDQGQKGQAEQEKEKQEIEKGQQESMKRKKLTKEQIEEILKELKKQESRVRAKEHNKNKGGKGSGKTW